MQARICAMPSAYTGCANADRYAGPCQRSGRSRSTRTGHWIPAGYVKSRLYTILKVSATIYLVWCILLLTRRKDPSLCAMPLDAKHIVRALTDIEASANKEGEEWAGLLTCVSLAVARNRPHPQLQQLRDKLCVCSADSLHAHATLFPRTRHCLLHMYSEMMLYRPICITLYLNVNA